MDIGVIYAPIELSWSCIGLSLEDSSTTNRALKELYRIYWEFNIPVTTLI